MDDSKEIRTMRSMAWERAKGELNSILQTFWSDNSNNYEQFRDELKKFVCYIEDHGLHE